MVRERHLKKYVRNKKLGQWLLRSYYYCSVLLHVVELFNNVYSKQVNLMEGEKWERQKRR